MGFEPVGAFLSRREVPSVDGAKMLISLLTSPVVGPFAPFVSIVATVLAPVSDDWYILINCLDFP